jgi:hypoxanthine phosphoribosyltransferase
MTVEPDAAGPPRDAGPGTAPPGAAGTAPPRRATGMRLPEPPAEAERASAPAVWTLLDRSTLRARVAELGARLRADYQGLEPILVSVLRGAVVFLADLVRAAAMPCQVDFMAVQRFLTSDETGVVRILKDLGLDVTGAHVVLVEDVVDTGLTLSYLLEVLAARRPASLRVCTLLDRRGRRLVEVPLAYVGFEIPDAFVFGYGLDLDERERGRDEILAVADPEALRRDPGLVPPRRS